MRCFVLICCTFILFLITVGCSERIDDEVDAILLTVDKSVVLPGDTVNISTEVHNHVDKRLSGIPLRYFANEQELSGPVFIPAMKGEFVISARFEDVISQKQKVDVITLEDNITALHLVYEGNTYLTTEEWSVSGSFSFEVELENLNFTIQTSVIELLINNEPVQERGAIYFDQPGNYQVKGRYRSITSNIIELTVREKLNLELIVIPVVFHDFGLQLNAENVNTLLDTLNGAFNIQSYPIEDVRSGLVNPNAVSMKIRFVAAEEAPAGFVLSGPGIHRIPFQDADSRFDLLALQNTWDPNTYVNVWLQDGQIRLDEEAVEGYNFYGRGGASIPILSEGLLEGLLTDPSFAEDAIAGIIVQKGSVLGEHPDYIVATMGNYFGLFQTIDFGCLDEGDYCADTHTIDFSIPNPPTNQFYTCDQTLFRPTNYLSINRKYRDFTYDQAVRVRRVLENAISRPSI